MEIESRPMKTWWVNVYRDEYETYTGAETLHHSREDALLAVDEAPDYLCTCPIEIPDLEGK